MQTTVIYTVGEPGSGKTYYRCMRFLIDDYLRNTKCKHVSNFPIQMEPWEKDGKPQAGFAAIAKSKGLDPDDVRERVLTFKPEDVATWFNHGYGTKGGDKHVYGPWDQLDGIDISGFHVAIDEIHNFCGTRSKPEVQARWAQWLGEIRHQGATVEFLTQSPRKVSDAITQHAGMRHRLLKSEERTDFWFKIPLYDWYQLKAKLLKRWATSFWQITERMNLDRWRAIDEKKFRLDPEYFGGYDSHSSPASGATAGSERPREWQTMSWPRLLLWFCSRNDAKLFLRGALLLLIPLFLIGGPFIAPMIFSAAPRWFAQGFKSETARKQTQSASTPGVNQVDPPAIVSQPEERTARPDKQTQFGRPAQPLTPEAADSPRVLLITPTAITLDDGATYRVREAIEGGTYVKKIDFQRREATLHDGRVVRIGHALGELPHDDPARQLGRVARVQRSLPAAATSGGERETSAAPAAGNKSQLR